VKDYEQSLPTPDEIQFRHDWSLHMLPREIGLYQQKTGQAPPPQLISKLKGDLDAVEQRDMYQYHYANNHGAKSWKSLPATNKIAGTLDYLQAHQMISPVQSRMFRNVEQRLTSETQLEQLATELWHIGGTGMVANAWKSIVKEVKPHPPLKANP
jgi:hypothetical protein